MQLASDVIRHFLTVDVALIGCAWGTGVLGAVFHYVYQHEAASKSLQGFVRFVFPKEILGHPSCRRDYLFAIVSRFSEPFTVGPILIGIPLVSLAVFGACQSLFGERESVAAGGVLVVATLALVLLVQDFVTWFTHWVEHKSKIMWEIHKVHHSVEFLNPISNRRHHPWQFVWESGLNNISVGVVLGLVSYLFRVPVMDNVLLGVDAYFFASVLSFYHLRHSHIPLHYGRWERYFLSPAQHQLHHSLETADWDKNFGLLTSIWDRLFGTIRYSVPSYRYRIGLQADVMKDYDSVWKFLVTPPVNIGKLLWQRVSLRRPPQAPAMAIDCSRDKGQDVLARAPGFAVAGD